MDCTIFYVKWVNSKETNFLAREKAMMVFFAQLLATITQLAFQILDAEVSTQCKKEGFQVDRKNERTVTFLFGSVTYVRRRMKNQANEIRYPLDEFLGIRKSFRYSSLVLRNVSQLGSIMVYRHVSQAIDCLTSWRMSHQNVQQLVVKTGGLIQTRSTHESRYDGIISKKKVPYLYLEGDGVKIGGQKKQSLEIHRFQVCEGSQKVGNRTEMIAPHFVSHLNRQQAQKEIMNYIQAHYDLTNTVVVSNSDGGSGYEKAVFDELSLGCLRHEHFRDRYHVHRKIKERLSFVPQLQNRMIQAIQHYNWPEVQLVLDTSESLIEEKEAETLEQLRLLHHYLQRNWPYLKPRKARGIVDPKACIGTIESTHRKMTYRMKRQGRLWTKTGAQAMIRVIDSLRNQEFDGWLNQYEALPNDVVAQEKRWKAMKRWVQKKPNFQTHEGAFKGQIGEGKAKSAPLGQFAKGLEQLITTPNYI
ncbi:ISLre2 family transposase [Tetragenococcus koreensis]|uniref:ISLre2 family transposase n=1 Tax=Tetragenococcus koreensis TaxID=290335 RepID=UPI000F4DE414|nr:ISLre2 family transposase [Tetragenococcus koreensis]AYW46093.1 ISLre2 family transposase [Tetragenococcus koreensis]